MHSRLTHSILLPLLFITSAVAQVSPWQNEVFWKLSGPSAIAWDLRMEERLPHSDNIEMNGRNVAGIITYAVDSSRHIAVTRDIIFPQLVRYLDEGESPWQRYRAYLRDAYTDEILPGIILGERGWKPGPVDSVVIDGTLNIFHSTGRGLSLRRTFLPSMAERAFCEIWTFTNRSDSTLRISIGTEERTRRQRGSKGAYTRRIFADAEPEVMIQPSGSYTFGIYMTASLNDEPPPRATWKDILTDRQAFLSEMRSNLILESPDPLLNTLFLFSKIRAAESIYQTDMGLVHSPGGGRYYTGVWANDQCEYSGPFFPYLGYETGNTAALNAYRQFARHLPEGDGHFWSSYEMNGDLTCCGGDRGDAAMIAYGASQFALSYGDRAIAEELWPLIEWSLEYCERQKNDAGVIRSDTDEMEGRIPTGGANLSTSSLTYGALHHAADLAASIGKSPALSARYRKRAEDLGAAIESYFGANIEGLDTYKYFEGHTFLRHWICLPLVMGIEKRKEGTLDALFSKLWTANGVRVEHNPGLEEPDLFWDRGTLYAFRGALKAGGTDRAIERLRSFSRTRLLGFHVPYVVEAWPEGNMAHLSAESALYCRIITEGLFGMTPTSLSSFDLKPSLPDGWDDLRLRNVRTNGRTYDIDIRRNGSDLRASVRSEGKPIIERTIPVGGHLSVSFE